jgi:two-component system NtrC family response regulator
MVLATFFLKRYCDLYNKRVRGFNSSALESMEKWAWPGNIRELENKIQRAVLLSDGPLIEPLDLGFDAKSVSPRKVNPEIRSLKDAKESIEKEMVIFSLERNEGNIAKSAEELGISRPTLYDLMKKYGLYNGTIQQETGEVG